MKKKIEARVTHRFSCKPERVYDAWLDPNKIRVWMAKALQSHGLEGDIRRIDVDPRVGGKFFFSDMREGGEACHWGSYLELDRPHRIVFTWIVDESQGEDPSKVALSITPDGEGCVVTIVHEMDAEWSDYVERTEAGWSRMLAAVEDDLAKWGNASL